MYTVCLFISISRYKAATLPKKTHKENKLQLLRRAPVRLDWVCTVPRVRHSLILWLRAKMLKGDAGRCGCLFIHGNSAVGSLESTPNFEGKEVSSGSAGQRILVNSMDFQKDCESFLKCGRLCESLAAGIMGQSTISQGRVGYPLGIQFGLFTVSI